MTIPAEITSTFCSTGETAALRETLVDKGFPSILGNDSHPFLGLKRTGTSRQATSSGAVAAGIVLLFSADHFIDMRYIPVESISRCNRQLCQQYSQQSYLTRILCRTVRYCALPAGRAETQKATKAMDRSVEDQFSPPGPVRGRQREGENRSTRIIQLKPVSDLIISYD